MAKRKARRKPKQFDLDIVIPVYGRADLLAECLASIPAAADNLNYQTILVDDQGPEQEELNELYRSLNSHSRVIRHDKNVGFPKTVNDGLKAGISPLVLVLNTDIELQADAFALMAAEFDDDKVGIVAPKLLFPHNSTDPHRPADKIQHAGLGVTFRGKISHLNIGWSNDHPKVNERRELQAVTGACLMFRREVVKGVMKLYREGGDPTEGPFNEVYSPGTYEDIEFCLAVRSLGYKVVYIPQAAGYHHVGGSVIKAGQGYPLNRNEMIFKARCGNMLAWDEYLWY
jgi:GT2 family glycosyltransferase